MVQKKSNIFKPLAIIGGIVALVVGVPFLLKAKNTLKTADTTTFDIVAINKWKLALTKLSFNVDIDAFNPTKNNLIINFLHLEFRLISNFLISTIDKTNWNFSLKPEQTTKISLPVEITGLNLLLLLKDTIGNIFKTKTPESIRVIGYIKANDFTTPIDKTVKVL